MTTYRSKETISAIQFQGTPIAGVTCDASSLDKDTREAAKYANGCDSSRAHHLHVHTMATGGMTVLKPSDWIFALVGGPWGTASDEKFRSHWEVPEVAAVESATAPAAPVTEPAPPPQKTLDELLAEAGLPSAEEIKAVMDDEAAGKVSTPDTPVGTVGVVAPAEELKMAIPELGIGQSPYISGQKPDAPIDHVEV